MKKNYLILTLVALLLSVKGFSQTQDGYKANPKYPQLFKTVPYIENDAPKWVHAMYSQNPNFNEIKSLYNDYYADRDILKTNHTQNYKVFIKSVNKLGNTNSDGTITLKEFKLPKSFQSTATVASLSSNGPSNWTSLGPKRTYHSVSDKVISRHANIFTFSQSISNPNTLIAGSQPGDVFLSTDKGENWQVLTDGISIPYRSVKLVKIDPNTDQIMYFSSNSTLYKSTDKGASWNLVKNFGGEIRGLTVKLGSSNDLVIVGTFGIQRSTDGGTTWTSINTKNTWDVVRKTNTPSTIFTLQVNATNNVIEFARSTDDGLTFTVYNSGWITPTGAKMQTAEGARMAVTNADPNVIYVLLLQSDTNSFVEQDYAGIMKSTDGGTNWTMPYDGNNDGVPDNTPYAPYGNQNWCLSTIGPDGVGLEQGFFNAAIDVSDTDPNTFIVGMINTFLSTNGGTSYQNIGGYSSCSNCFNSNGTRHADVQDVEINGSDIWVVTDGGIDKYSTDFTTATAKINNLVASEFYGFDQAWNKDVVVGGRNHNGNIVMSADYTDQSAKNVGGGEQNTGYLDLVGDIARFSDSPDVIIPKNTADPLVFAPYNYGKYPKEYYDPKLSANLAVNPNKASEIILGRFNQIWKSTDRGISFNLMTTFTGGTYSSSFNERVTKIAYASNNTNILFALQAQPYPSSKVFKSIDGGVTWVEQAAIPGTYAMQLLDVQIAADNDDEVYLSYSTSLKTKIFKSLDGGSTWNELPTFSGSNLMTMLIQDGTDGGLYIGNANGIHYINNSMTTWQPYNTGLPASKQPISIKPYYKEGKLRLATSNRGVWESPMFESSNVIARPVVQSEKYNCLKDTVRFSDHSIIKHAGATWNWSFPGATYVSSTTEVSPKVLYGAIGNYNVTLTITDANGSTDTKTITDMVKIEENLCELKYVPTKALFSPNNFNYRFLESEKDLDYVAPGNNLTLSAWVKPTAGSTGNQGIIRLSSDFQFGSTILNIKHGFYLSASSGQLVYYEGTTLSGSSLKLKSGEWNYVAAVWNGGTLTLYVNDQKETRTVNNFTNASRKGYIVGDTNGSGNGRFKGALDEIKIYKRSLSTEEIYASRHIIKDITTDPDLLAYYQFNSQSSSGKHFNLVDINKSLVPGLVSSNSSSFSLVDSDAPLGPGVTQKINVTANGIADFDQVGLKIDFASGDVPNGDIVVTKLSKLPENHPTTEIISNDYWIINNYGSNETVGAINSFEFSNVPSGGLMPSNVSLYKRKSNDSDSADWGGASVATATALDNSAKTITFGGTNITSFSQFYLGSDLALSNQEFIKDSFNDIMPYPNPNNGEVKFKGDFKQLNFKLYDLSGKLLHQSDLESGDNSLEIKNISNGIYFYKIQTEDKMRSGKLLFDK